MTERICTTSKKPINFWEKIIYSRNFKNNSRDNKIRCWPCFSENHEIYSIDLLLELICVICSLLIYFIISCFWFLYFTVFMMVIYLQGSSGVTDMESGLINRHRGEDGKNRVALRHMHLPWVKLSEWCNVISVLHCWICRWYWGILKCGYFIKIKQTEHMLYKYCLM